MSAELPTLRDNVARVQERIASSAARVGRNPLDVQLIAVSKTIGAEVVAEAVNLGLRHFGENRVQEAAAKIPRVSELTNTQIEWHLIGTLQRNKVRAALPLFAILHSVDSPRLAEAVSQRAESRTIPVLLEVYLGDDPARPGFRPAELTQQIGNVAALPGLRLQGLMTVAPFGLDERGSRQVFATLRELRDRLVAGRPGLHMPELSMGMTDDFEFAIAEGSTMVRVGRAIFGERPYQFSG